MIYYAEILSRFDFAESDMEYINSINENMAELEDAFVKDVIAYLQKDKLFMSEYGYIIEKLNTDKLSLWYRGIIAGKLNGYFSEFVSDFNLHQVPHGGFSGERISELFNFIRLWIQSKLIEIASCEWDYKGILQAYTKVINVNMGRKSFSCNSFYAFSIFNYYDFSRCRLFYLEPLGFKRCSTR